MVQPIRTTISFSDKATAIINAVEPANLSEFISEGVVMAYESARAYNIAQINEHIEKARKLAAVAMPDKEILIEDKK
jgi:hypothetical protein